MNAIGGRVTQTIQSIDSLIEEHLQALHGLFGALDGCRPAGRRLSVRELEVATLAASTPLTNRQIAARLYLSEATVKTLLCRSFQKLGVRRRGQLLQVLASRAVAGC